MSDSNLVVNHDARGFEPFICTPATSADVKGNRDDVVSSFVRMKIRDWRDSDRELQELARVAGFAKSTPSQVLQGTGVGAKTGPKFARAFGFSSYDDLKSAAWEWWQLQGKAGREAVSVPKTEAMAEAIEAVLLLNQGTREQLETIMVAFAHERFRGRDRDWWIQILLAELAADRTTIRQDRDTRASINADQRELRAVGAASAAKKKAARQSNATPKRRAS